MGGKKGGGVSSLSPPLNDVPLEFQVSNEQEPQNQDQNQESTLLPPQPHSPPPPCKSCTDEETHECLEDKISTNNIPPRGYKVIENTSRAFQVWGGEGAAHLVDPVLESFPNSQSQEMQPELLGLNKEDNMSAIVPVGGEEGGESQA